MKPVVFGFIFARGGSKGVPRKNIRDVAGKPLIAWSIEAAQKSQYVDKIIVSTDDPEIARVAEKYGASVPFMRPPELASDTAPEWLAWRHALTQVGCSAQGAAPLDVFLSIPATAPLRSPEDLDVCVSALIAHPDTDAVITVCAAARHPSFNMVSLNAQGQAGLVLPLDGITRRQDTPAVYDITTVAYALRPAFIFQAERLFDGVVRTVEVPQERALDIDTEWDMKIADFFLCQRVNP